MFRQALMFAPDPLSLSFLSTIAGSPAPESRRVVLRVITDCFVLRNDHLSTDIARFQRSALPLLAGADPVTRLMIARKLVAHPQTPTALLDAIIELGGAPAFLVLERASGAAPDLLIRAASGDPAFASAIARRADLDPEMILLLAQRSESEIALALAGNAEAALHGKPQALLIDRARSDEALARAMLARPGVGIEVAALFLFATPAQRRLILAAAQRAELGRALLPQGPGASPALLLALEHQALSRRDEAFAATLAKALNCSEGLAERIASEASGEPLTVALAALDAPRDVTLRILLSAEPLRERDPSRVAALARLKEALHPLAAQHVISALAGPRADARPQTHKPMHDQTAASTPSRAQPGSIGRAPTVQAEQRRSIVRR
jgi:uncharacterized protein (DUF2336 family)